MSAILGPVHRVLGFLLSLWLVLLGTTGALLAFRDEWVPLTGPSIDRPALAEEGPPSAAQLARRARAAETGFGKDRVWALVLAGPAVAYDQVYLFDGAGGGYLDPQTGAVVGRWIGGERFVDVLFELHRSLLLGATGKKVVGLVGLVGAGLMLSGLALAWPMWRRWRGSVWPRNRMRAGLVAAHRELGLIAALPLLMTTLTGTALVFPATAKTVLRALSAEPPPPPIARVASSATTIAWEAVFAGALARFPDAAPRAVVWPNAPDAAISVWLRQPAEWHPNGRTTFHATAAGEPIDSRDALAAPLADRLVNAAYAVHAGKVGGLLYRSLIALTGLALALLASYGAISYARHLFRPKR